MSEPFSGPSAGLPRRPLTGRERRAYERDARKHAAMLQRLEAGRAATLAEHPDAVPFGTDSYGGTVYYWTAEVAQ